MLAAEQKAPAATPTGNLPVLAAEQKTCERKRDILSAAEQKTPTATPTGNLPVLAAEQKTCERKRDILSAAEQKTPTATPTGNLPVLAAEQETRERKPTLATCPQAPANLCLPCDAARARAVILAALALSAASQPSRSPSRSHPCVVLCIPTPWSTPCMGIAACVGLWPRRPPSRQRHSSGQTPIEPSVPPPCSPGGTEERAVRATVQGTGCKHTRGR